MSEHDTGERARSYPFATGGGGVVFEHRVGAWFLKDLLLGNLDPLGGQLTTVQFQPGDQGPFDDLRLTGEPSLTRTSITNIQVRYRQPLTAANRDFQLLLRHIDRVVRTRSEEVKGDHLRYVLALSRRSPAWQSLQLLCRASRLHGSSRSFFAEMARSNQSLRSRLMECRDAIGSRVSDERVYEVLRILTVQVFDLDDRTSEHVASAINELAGRLWQPPDHVAAEAVMDRMAARVTEWESHGAIVDRDLLRGVLDDVPGVATLGSRREQLNELYRAARGRVEASIRLLGAQEDLAVAIADRALQRRPITPADEPVQVVVGELGIGKSTYLEGLHMDAIAAALEDPAAPLPVRVEATSLAHTSLEGAAAAAALPLGGAPSHGVRVVVDGVDEVALDLPRLVRDASALVSRWPRSNVTIATRPTAQLQHLPKISLPPLTDDESTELIELIAVGFGQPTRFAREALAEAVRRPLFTILYALRLASGRIGAVSTAELVEEFGERVVRDLSRESERSYSLHVRLAVAVIDRDGEKIPLRDLFDHEDRIILESSRLLRVENGLANFQLAVLTEWFAAQHLLDNPELIAELSEEPGRIHSWRHVCTQALATGAERAVDTLARELVIRAPAPASSALRQATASSLLAGRPVTARRILTTGESLRDAMQVWLNTLGPLNRFLICVDEDGNQLPLGVAVLGDQLVTAWDSSGETTSPVVRLPPNVHPVVPQPPPRRWVGARSGRLSTSPTWAWEWGREIVVSAIDSILASGTLEAGAPSLARELVWAYGLAVVGKGDNSPIPIVALDHIEQSIQRVIERNPEAQDVTVKAFGAKDWLLSEAIRLRDFVVADGSGSISAPWPRRDLEGGGWVWELWSTDALLERVRKVTRTALDAYAEIVNRWFPNLRASLGLAQILPARIVGQFRPSARDGTFQGQPAFAWYVEPSEEPENGSSWSTTDQRPDIGTDWEARHARVEALRPSLGTSHRVSVHYGQPSGLLSGTPAAALALDLLLDDLYRYGLTTKRRVSEQPRVRPPGDPLLLARPPRPNTNS